MPFDSSLPDEVAPGEATAFRCKFVSTVDSSRCERIYDHAGNHVFGPFKEQCGSVHKVPQLVMTDGWVQRCVLPPGHKGQHSSGPYAWDQDPAFVAPGPKDSASSSPGECRRCGHHGSAHLVRETHGQRGCQWQILDYEIEDRRICPCEQFVPADAETAEPEAPECSHDSWEVTGEHHTPEGWVKSRRCADCREGLGNIIEAEPHWDLQPVRPRRPPYAVAYEIGDGRLYEVALSGDAVATVEDGVLKVSHPEGVVHMIQVKPLEGA